MKGMSDFVTALTSALTPAALWGSLAPLAALIGVVVIFALSVHFVRRMVSGVGRGKAKI